MKQLILIFTLLFGFQYLTAQEDGPYKEYYDTGELKVEGQFLDGKRIGDWVSYHKNGQVSSNYGYIDGKPKKEYVRYFEDGTVSLKNEIINGEVIQFSYYESGALSHKRQVANGYYRGYYETGELKIKSNYIKNELEGEWEKFYKNGQLEWVVNYKDGYRDGSYKKFSESGDLVLEGKNSKDKINGEEIRYKNGRIVEWKGQYQDGLLSKTWTKFNDDGNKILKVKFKNGQAIDADQQNLITPTKVVDGVYERVPVYPGCENLLNNSKRHGCLNRSVAMFINKNFNTSLSAIMPSGKYRILATFKVLKNGKVEVDKINAPNEIMEYETNRVLSLLPNIQPGTQRGEPVVVPLSIPIVFQIQ